LRYLVDEGRQRLLVAAAAADHEARDWPAVGVRVYRQLVAEQQSGWNVKTQKDDDAVKRWISQVLSPKRSWENHN